MLGIHAEEEATVHAETGQSKAAKVQLGHLVLKEVVCDLGGERWILLLVLRVRILLQIGVLNGLEPLECQIRLASMHDLVPERASLLLGDHEIGRSEHKLQKVQTVNYLGLRLAITDVTKKRIDKVMLLVHLHDLTTELSKRVDAHDATKEVERHGHNGTRTQVLNAALHEDFTLFRVDLKKTLHVLQGFVKNRSRSATLGILVFTMQEHIPKDFQTKELRFKLLVFERLHSTLGEVTNESEHLVVVGGRWKCHDLLIEEINLGRW
mmetsp:Transcript_25772/g.64731  ORF Transcript_25772/g.64731 Transcript_25772/m.64731 type:complete len:266 (-) Transcript_25772:569-1366(-)